jgi:hypothetical protein
VRGPSSPRTLVSVSLDCLPVSPVGSTDDFTILTYPEQEKEREHRHLLVNKCSVFHLNGDVGFMVSNSVRDVTSSLAYGHNGLTDDSIRVIAPADVFWFLPPSLDPH